MSSIIESASRHLKGSLPGLQMSEENRALQAARGKDLIKNLALGGLALGGTAGAAVVLGNYLKSLGDEAEVYDDSRLNDDTLYVPLGEKKAASSDGPRWTAPGLAITGGVLSAGGAYALTQAIYNYLQKKHNQKLLDEAQNEAWTAADAEAQKSAALGMTLPELISAFPVALPLLAAIASGGVTYSALNKTFPTVQTPKSKYPKRIRAVSADGQVSDVPELDAEGIKSASDLAGEADCEAAAMEFMTLLTDNLALSKKAEHSITSDILNAVARDGIAPLAAAYETSGLPGLCMVTKSASAASDSEKVVAAAAIYRHPRLAPVVGCVAAAEFQDLVPTVMAKCAGMSHDALDKAAGIGALLHLAFVRPVMLKEAAASPALLAELSAMLNGEQPNLAGGHDATDEAMTTDSSGSMAEENEGGDKKDDGLDDESQGANDSVDGFFERPPLMPPPN